MMPAGGLSDRQVGVLQELGIDLWQWRENVRLTASDQFDTKPQANAATLGRGAEISNPETVRPDGDWETVHNAIRNCTRCALHETRTQAVCGSGDTRADWLIVGEAPGADEDRQGEPFVGRAGQLLNEMLRAIGLRREQVFIANVLKCRPPNNRDPQPAEIAQCQPYLQRQIELLRPKVILVVGRIAAQTLLQVDKPLGQLRGQAYEYGGVPVVVTYHPAYLLRTSSQKAKAWEDLLLALDVMTEAK